MIMSEFRLPTIRPEDLQPAPALPFAYADERPFSWFLGPIPIEFALGGRETGGAACPVCERPYPRYRVDERGALIEHPGRRYPCRWPVTWR